MKATDLPKEQYGPNIPFREYSLLKNPRMYAAHVQPGGNPKMAAAPFEPAIVQVCEVRMNLVALFSLIVARLLSSSCHIKHERAGVLFTTLSC